MKVKPQQTLKIASDLYNGAGKKWPNGAPKRISVPVSNSLVRQLSPYKYLLHDHVFTYLYVYQPPSH